MLHSQFAAHHNCRSFDSHPAFVDGVVVEQFGGASFFFCERYLVMIHRVEDANDVAVNEDCPWDPDGLAESSCDSFGDARLSVAGIAEQEHAATTVNCWAETQQKLA